MRKFLIFFCFLLITLFFGLQARADRQPQLYRKSVSAGEAREVKSDIRFFAGSLYMGTSTERLSECFYGYKDEFIRPFVKYNVVDHTGYLTIRSMKEDENHNGNKKDNKWSIQINKHLKNDLSIDMMAGEADIDLEGAHLSKFQYRMTAGEADINLRNTSVPYVKMNVFAGETHLNLSGAWRNDCTVDLHGGFGAIYVKVPYHVGVKVVVSGLLGEVSIPFFHRDRRVFTNDAWEKSEYQIVVNISGAIGEVHVDMTE